MAQTKIASKAVNVKLIDSMLRHFQAYNFIKTISNRTIEFSFLSKNLKEFIRREWILTNVMSSDQPAFMFHSLHTNENLRTAFEDINNLLGSHSFSIVESGTFCSETEKPLPQPKCPLELVSNQFKRQSGTILRSHYFCSPTEVLDVFCKKQRAHKLWWRKFSAVPARFINSKVDSCKNKKSMISEIQAEFPWGFETVETIKYQPDFYYHDNTFIKAKSNKHIKSMPQVITCESILETMTFTYLCDSYEKLNGEKDRDLLKFNKRLAPFKVAVAGAGGDSSESVKNLQELSLLLSKQVRKSGFSVLLLPDACTTPITSQVLRNDALGVLYTILLNDKTLKDGTLTLRSRDTTLEEQSHVSLIVDYLNKILK